MTTHPLLEAYEDAMKALKRLAIVAEKPAHLIRWGEGDRLDLQSVLAALSPPEGEAVAWAMLQRDGSVLSVQGKPYHEGFAQMMATDCGCTVQALGPVHPSPEMGEISADEIETILRDNLSLTCGRNCEREMGQADEDAAYRETSQLILSKLKENGLSREDKAT